jgi:dihydroorotate dehydrogenase
MQIFAEVGVRAVIATNSLPMPTPDDTGLTAGVGGGTLHARAVAVARLLTQTGSGVDVIGCGGVEDRASYDAYTRLGIQAVQYWSSLVYRGPLAAALIAYER